MLPNIYCFFLRRSQTLSPVRNFHTMSLKPMSSNAKEPQFVEIRNVKQQNLYKPMKVNSFRFRRLITNLISLFS